MFWGEGPLSKSFKKTLSNTLIVIYSSDVKFPKNLFLMEISGKITYSNYAYEIILKLQNFCAT